jgi:carbon monoxide dehydrogenase subunit G
VPNASFSHSAVVSSSREQVWAALDLPETWNSIAGVDRVHEPIMDSEGRLHGFKFDTLVAGKAYEGIAGPHARVEGEAMSWDIVNSQIRGVIHVELSDVTDGTLLDVGVDIESVSMFSSMFFGVISKTVGEGLPRTVEEMAASL